VIASRESAPPVRAAVHRRWAMALLLVVGAVQAALALGAPFGAAAWGGAHAGVLPPELRWSSAAAVPVYLLLVRFVATGRTSRARRFVYAGLALLFAIGALMNAASPSWVERALWTPVAAMLAYRFVSLWREEPRAGG
jgi:hypothetical protein